ncbi:hypothetical protein SISNIDRAFT_467154 [Sistotremastrum niveocremeum HHB9708]|uniref:Tyrosinase C-terminal domain-containing protein n=1 Tax=Sistotremastrum niveocremeum HHB9708 TaxID=1314777 RepID=A0A164TF12_9AGAM|nr:hypothetical protein SISNIDRAFT_467154 [Sistotremastrum niveocremeum HHB9708]
MPLDHCNVDRQFAIWQALNPNAWFSDPSQQLTDPEGNWSTPAGQKVKPKWGLAPFHVNAHGQYFNSDDIRDWQKYGYSYPELQPWLEKYWPNGQFSQPLYTASIRAAVNNLYSNSRSVLLDSTSGSDVQTSQHDYVVNVIYKKFALGGDAFKVHIYVGKDKEVGTVYNFSARPEETGGPEGCGNCRSQQEDETLATGQVHVTVPLLDAVQNSSIALSSLHPDHVEEYLKKHLHWKVTKLYGEEVPLDSIPSLKVSLAVGTGDHYKDETQLSNKQTIAAGVGTGDSEIRIALQVVFESRVKLGYGHLRGPNRNQTANTPEGLGKAADKDLPMLVKASGQGFPGAEGTRDIFKILRHGGPWGQGTRRYGPFTTVDSRVWVP